MISAFGVEHSIEKSYKKLGPKLAAVQRKGEQQYSIGPLNMKNRMKYNYAVARKMTGETSKISEPARSRIVARGAMKPEADASMKAVANINRRRPDRRLP